MPLRRLLLVPLILAGLAGTAFYAQERESPGLKMTDAAGTWLAGLKAEQKAKAAFPFDSKERTNWNFVPLQDADRKSTRKGLPLEDMSADQREAARALVASGTSAAGYKKTLAIMNLEAILRELETNGKMVRNPEWYFFTVFGTPSKAGRWGWRVEGHHLSLNFTVDAGKVVSATPAFFGANPAEIKAGPKKGTRTLPEAEDHAKALFASLDEEQTRVARQKGLLAEIEQAKPSAEVGAPVGLPGASMKADQKALLWKLIEGYARRLPGVVADEQLARAKDAGLDKVHFAFAQDDTPNKPYTYRVQGPTFVIMFLNVQPDAQGNVANHIHSVWRNLPIDFGLAAK